MRRAWLVVTLLGCEVATEVTPRAIVAGTAAPDEVAVVAIAHRAVACEPGATPLDCTGTLIAPRVVLTAAHCLSGGPATALAVSFAAVFDGATLEVVGGAAHPGFDATTHAHDVAVLVLAADAPAGTPPIALRTTALPDLTGTDVRLVGYGITTGAGTDVGTRRAGLAQVTAVDADTVAMAPHPAMSCHGDSGGPVLAGAELIGVTSYGDPACAELGVAIRVDRELAFIQPFLDAVRPDQRAFDPGEPLCATACETDADCPVETACFAARCVYHGLPAGELGARCASGGACACVATPDGCREFHPCSVEPGEACGPIARDGCGCHSGGGSGWLVAIATAAAYGNGRSGAKKRSKRASVSPVAAT